MTPTMVSQVQGSAEIRHVFPFGLGRPHTALYVNNRLAMMDVPSERRINETLASRFRGNVAVCGLGLGLFVEPTMNNPNVRSIVIVEKNPDVALLVGPRLAQVPPRLKGRSRIYVDDAFTFPTGVTDDGRIPTTPGITEGPFDCVHFDIWSVPGRYTPIDHARQLDELAQLSTLWSPVMKPDGKMTAWLGGQLVPVARTA